MHELMSAWAGLHVCELRDRMCIVWRAVTAAITVVAPGFALKILPTPHGFAKNWPDHSQVAFTAPDIYLITSWHSLPYIYPNLKNDLTVGIILVLTIP